MSYRSQDNDDDYDAAKYWKRKQSTNINRVMGDGDLPLAPPDRDCDAEDNFSYGKSGYSKMKNTGKSTSSTIWDEDPWKDKS